MQIIDMALGFVCILDGTHGCVWKWGRAGLLDDILGIKQWMHADAAVCLL